jgi:hypothetical protein
MEKTAVEYLIEQLIKEGKLFYDDYKSINQAKEMEKQQIIDAFDTAKYLSSSKNYNGEKYYKDTFSN